MCGYYEMCVHIMCNCATDLIYRFCQITIYLIFLAFVNTSTQACKIYDLMILLINLMFVTSPILKSIFMKHLWASVVYALD